MPVDMGFDRRLPRPCRAGGKPTRPVACLAVAICASLVNHDMAALGAALAIQAENQRALDELRMRRERFSAKQRRN